jgi:hypothetical protein
MTIDEIKAGPGDKNPPKPGKWTIVSAKSEGVTPGFNIRDESGELFVVKFDPLAWPELTTGADMISSRILHAAGYYVPEYYIVHFTVDDLQLGDDVNLRDERGGIRKMRRQDVVELLLDVPRDSDGRWRGIASRMLKGRPLGPFRFDGTRSDDPNDIVPHEHLRALRGYRVLCALLNHDDSRSINSLDMLVNEEGRQYIKHYLIDFGSSLGSGTWQPNSPRNGSEYWFEPDRVAKNLFSLGIYMPAWMKADLKTGRRIRGVGNFESEYFDPMGWKPEYQNPAFLNANPDDLFWAAKQVMSLTDEQIRAAASVAEFTDSRAAEYLAKHLIVRREKIGRVFFAGVLPIDKFRVAGGELKFVDLEVQHGFVDSRHYTVQWSRFDNQADTKTVIDGADGFRVPVLSEGAYLAADIEDGRPDRTVTVYLRKRSGKIEVVGVDRTFPKPAFARN